MNATETTEQQVKKAEDAFCIGSGGIDASAYKVVPTHQEDVKKSWQSSLKRRLLEFLTSLRTERAWRFILPIPLLMWMSYKPVPQVPFAHLGIILYCIQAALLPPVVTIIPILLFCALPAACTGLAATTLFWTIWAMVAENRLSETAADIMVIVLAFFYFLLLSNLRLGPIANLMTICYYASAYSMEYASILAKTVMSRGIVTHLPPTNIRNVIPGGIAGIIPDHMIDAINNLTINFKFRITKSLLGSMLSLRGVKRFIGLPITVIGSLINGIFVTIPGGTYLVRYAWEGEPQFGIVSAIVVWGFISYAAFLVSLFIPPIRSGSHLYHNAVRGCHSIIAANLLDWMNRVYHRNNSSVQEDMEIANLLGEHGNETLSQADAPAASELRAKARRQTVLPPIKKDYSSVNDDGHKSPQDTIDSTVDQSTADFNPYYGYDINRYQTMDQIGDFVKNGNLLKFIEGYNSYRTRFNLALSSIANMQAPLLLSVFEAWACSPLPSSNHNLTNDVPERLRLTQMLENIATSLYVIQIYTILREKLRPCPTGHKPEADLAPSSASINTLSHAIRFDGPEAERSSNDITSTRADQGSADVPDLSTLEDVKETIYSESKVLDFVRRQRNRNLTFKPNIMTHIHMQQCSRPLVYASTSKEYINQILWESYHSVRLSELNDYSKHSINANYTQRRVLEEYKRIVPNARTEDRILPLLYKTTLLQACYEVLELRRDAYIQLRTVSWKRALMTLGTIFMGLPLYLYCLFSPWANGLAKLCQKEKLSDGVTIMELSLNDGLQPELVTITAGECCTNSFTTDTQGVCEMHISTAESRWSALKHNSSIWYAVRLAVGNTFVFALAVCLERWRTVNILGRHRNSELSRFINLEELTGTKYAAWACIGFITTITESAHACLKRAALRFLGVLIGTVSAYLCVLITPDNWLVHSAWAVITCFIAVWFTAHPANPAIGFDPSWGYAAQLFTYQQIIIMSLVAAQDWNIHELVISRLLAQLIGIATAVLVSLTINPTFHRHYIRHQSLRALQHLQKHMGYLQDLHQGLPLTSSKDQRDVEMRHAIKCLANCRRCLGDNELFIQWRKLNVDTSTSELVDTVERLIKVRLLWVKLLMHAGDSVSAEVCNVLNMLRIAQILISVSYSSHYVGVRD